MRLLLDTHILLWSVLEPERLEPHAMEALQDAENQLWLSPISVWECLVLARKGRLKLDPDPESWVRDMLDALPFRQAPLNHEVAIVSRSVQLPHQDPADRFLVATARVYDLTLVTVDQHILDAGACELLAAPATGGRS
ncbi:MAG: type II toxin-antitoxin system VapC family toxin [Deltaproteobacteria bacterium]|nr:type II toxin-antitoxin system VapC family toxin [Deltaproteobacteria bacterium]